MSLLLPGWQSSSEVAFLVVRLFVNYMLLCMSLCDQARFHLVFSSRIINQVEFLVLRLLVICSKGFLASATTSGHLKRGFVKCCY